MYLLSGAQYALWRLSGQRRSTFFLRSVTGLEVLQELQLRQRSREGLVQRDEGHGAEAME